MRWDGDAQLYLALLLYLTLVGPRSFQNPQKLTWPYDMRFCLSSLFFSLLVPILLLCDSLMLYVLLRHGLEAVVTDE
jgi:hypothetical protein